MSVNLFRFGSVLHAVAVLALAVLVSCGTTARHYKGKEGTTDADGDIICMKHRQKVIEVDGYRQSDEICVLPDPDYIKWRIAFPMPRPLGVSSTRSAFYVEPVHYIYCSACEEAIKVKMEEEKKRRRTLSKFGLKTGG
ncbi:hypothetical protein DES53_11313 [Roseimicrobium gellanilyticum]|uniref:Uncharacterized protein n=1 Tax=Roseimicrobium gellanilyticum TaxID=748857 RepID=A0A366H8D9_9BACT|nr:hypothetical protein [Roseimicrobium gellanilyticum]RBP37631.1 hypothetical protein DES53_11313 [Roseimicrobium gellanilyticum]